MHEIKVLILKEPFFHKNSIVEKLLELLLLFTIVHVTLRVFIYVFHFTKKEKNIEKK